MATCSNLFDSVRGRLWGVLMLRRAETDIVGGSFRPLRTDALIVRSQKGAGAACAVKGLAVELGGEVVEVGGDDVEGWVGSEIDREVWP